MDPVDLLNLLGTLQSTLGVAARTGDRAGMRAVVAGRVACWMALADLAEDAHPAYVPAFRRLARVEGESLPDVRDGDRGVIDGEREGRHSVARRPGGSRPRPVTRGRHAGERQAAARAGRHSAPDEAAGPIPIGGRLSVDVVSRGSGLAAILGRALAHETPVSELGPAPVRAAREAAVTSGGSTAVERSDDAAEQWAAEHWMPTQRRKELREAMVQPVGWHPVPRPRHAADAGPGAAPAPGVADRLAG